MSDVFGYAVERVLKREKGYVDDPNDNGGATNLGITISTLSQYRGRSCTKEDVRNLTVEEAKLIYKKFYWDAVRADEFNPAIAFILFDGAVQHGPVDSIKLVQRSMKLTPDGVIGPMTFAALRRGNVHETIENALAERALYYSRLSDWVHFGKGWMRRLMEVAMIAGCLAAEA